MTTSASRQPQPRVPHHVRASTPTEPKRGSLLRVRLGAAIQRQRLLRRLTQWQLAERAGVSLKYVGEIERGEANTTLDVLERLADELQWDPMEAFEGVREPITEGVRRLLIAETQWMTTRASVMVKWLEALDPALDESVRGVRLRELMEASAKPAQQAVARRRRDRDSPASADSGGQSRSRTRG